eukprot:6213465-Pleurochrysis_carterae.AAC.1
MKASIDMSAPKSYPHVHTNAKRMQMESERNFAIERENKILLGKMYNIMNAEPNFKTERTQVSSLNMSVRKQEYDKIARENQVSPKDTMIATPHLSCAECSPAWELG